MNAWKAINGMVAILAIGGLDAYALSQGHDGAYLSLALAGMAGIAGVKIGGIKK